MNEYEITYIINTKAGEEGRDSLNAEVEKKIADMEGKIEHASAALREQLAFPIQDQPAGFIRVMNIALDPAAISKLDLFFKKNKHILRYMILSTPRREELPGDLLQKLHEESGKSRSAKKEDKEVSMQDVEKGIEDALSEDVA